jgi:poly-gamma-glutamate synthase PgsB/CapB
MTAVELLALLPPFEAWTGRRVAEAVASQLAAGRTLLEVMAAALEERDRRSAALASTAGIEAGWQALTGAPPDRRTRRAIATGALGPEALAERLARDVARLEREALVAFLAQSVRERGSALTAAFDRAAEQLADEPGWRLARAGLQALTERARLGRWPSAGLMARARSLVAAGRAPVWTQVAAIELLAATLGNTVAGVFWERVAPSGRPDDVFVRPAAARALALVDPAGARERLPALLDQEPSEHVRMELARVLGILREAGPLRRLLDPAREPSPRVRAVAAIAVAAVEPAALVVVLAADPDELPRRIALEEAEPLAANHPGLTSTIDALASGKIPVPVPVARLAAEAAERLHQGRDPEASAAARAVSAATRGASEGSRRNVEGPLSAAALGRALAVASTDDFGLEAWPVRGGFVVARGDRVCRRLWRALHEARHPAPEKRAGHLHTVGRARPGVLRAPPGRLAEVTATRVPGERVLVPALGDWGRHLPTVDDLLDRPRGGEALVFSAFGVTRLRFPASTAARLRARTRLTLRYAHYAELRARSLAATDAPGRALYATAVAALGFGLVFTPHRSGAPAEILDVFRGAGEAAAPVAALGLMLPSLAELLRGTVDPAASGAGHLAALTAAAVGLFVVRQNESRRRIERARAAIPLTLGGWGTRGKSGTERLKAALFQGLGCEVLAKTTGCEAMFIHAIPGLRAQEVFIYRPYDKATIWEQQQLLELAARLGVDVFLWECMALRPEYVTILEQHWMRDGACTLTNTYPDHENLQGPAGIDIPRAMVDFIPRGQHLLTAEDSMLPVLREAAGERSAALTAASFREHALLPADLLARFPYDEHPRNVALVLSLARLLGVPPELAIKEMADWVVPDLGVLKTYPEARWRHRRLEFANGMSANERTGFLGNWQRLGFDRPSPPGEWVVTVVNNRADRVSRSEVFAEVIVEDAPAHLHVLIGTNVAGLRGYLERALAATLRRLVLVHREEDTLHPDRLETLMLERAARALERLRIGDVGPAALAETAQAMARGLGVTAPITALAFEGALAAALASGRQSPEELEPLLAAPLAEALTGFATALGAEGESAVGFLIRLAARHAAVLRWQRSARGACTSAASRGGCEAAFRALFATLFRRSVLALEDPGLSGDQVIDAVARACPPGFRVRIMGAQNIKGTGLDFAYRWIAHERIVRLAASLATSPGPAALAVSAALARDEDTGVLDGPVALAALRAAAAGEKDSGVVAALRADAAIIEARQRQREEALGQRRQGRGPMKRAFDGFIEVYAGIRRRHRADAIVGELAEGRLGHDRAALALRDLTRRSGD